MRQKEKILNYLDEFVKNIEYKDSLKIIPFLIASIIAALTALIYSEIFFWGEDLAINIIENSHWIISFGVTVGMIYLSWYLPFRISKNAGGSGIPQMLKANDLNPETDSKEIRSLIGIRVIILKIISSVICVLGGGSVGQEGPTLQISSGIFYRIGERSRKWISDISMRSFILAGGASGLAAAFNTPLGGIAYALEELSKDYFNNFKTYVLWSVIISGLIVQTFQGSYLYLGFPSIESLSIESYLWIIATSILTAIAGAKFGAVLFRIHKSRNKVQSFKALSIINICCGICFWFLLKFVSIHAAGGGKMIITNMLFRDGHSNIQDIFARISGPLLMALAGAAGGLFAPSLAIGAVLGSFISQIVWPHNHHLLILTGMIAFLTAFMRTPFTAFILIFEMTDRHNTLFPMMLSASIAASVARMFEKHSFYESVKNDSEQKIS